MIDGPAAWRRDGRQPAPVEQARDRLAEHQPGGGLVEAGVGGHAQRHVETTLRAPVGRIGGEHDPLGGDAREQLDDVEPEEAGGVVQHAGVLGEHRGEDPLVADRAVGEDQHDLGVAQRELGEPLGDRRQAAAGVDQDRHARLFGDLEDPLQLVAVEGELLGARVQLDPAGAGGEAALGLGNRAVEGVEAAEGNQTSVAFARPREHAIVGHAVGGAALGVVQREHAGAPCAGLVELREQLLERQRAPILVEPEVGVRVEHLGAGGQQPLCFGDERRKRVGVERGIHGRHPIGSTSPAASSRGGAAPVRFRR